MVENPAMVTRADVNKVDKLSCARLIKDINHDLEKVRTSLIFCIPLSSGLLFYPD